VLDARFVFSSRCLRFGGRFSRRDAEPELNTNQAVKRGQAIKDRNWIFAATLVAKAATLVGR